MEELEPRLTPAEVGVNDFRVSFMGPDGNPNFAAFAAAVAYNGRANEYLVVWSGDDVTDEEIEIFGQRLDAATGAPIGGKIRLSDMGPDGNAAYQAFEPAVAYNPTSNEYLVVWSGDDNTGTLVNDEFEIFGQRINADPAAFGEVGTNDFRISDMGPDHDIHFTAGAAAVAYNPTNNEYLVVWHGDDTTDGEYEIFGQRLTAAGAEVGTNDFRLSHMGPDGNITFSALEPAVAYNGVNNEYLVVWQGDDNTPPLVASEYEIFGQRLSATGALVGGRNRLSDMGPDGNLVFGAFNPAVTYNGAANEYLVAWQGDDTTHTEYEIYGQRVSAATGAEVGVNDFRLSDMGPDGDIAFDASEPAVAYNPTSNEYLVVWSGDDNTGTLVAGESEIFGQRLDAATGVEVGANDFRLSDMGPDGDTRFEAFRPAVASNGAASEYLVVWEGDDNTAPLVDNESEIFGQRFASPLPPPPPPPAPPSVPPQQIAAVAFRQKGRAKVRVTDAATGTVRAVLTPFRGFAGRLVVQLRDLNGDGALDLVVRALIHGKRRQKVYDAVTLAPLPPGLA